MTYVLGIDIGGTSTLATVVRRRGAGWSRPEPVRLGGGSAAVASVLRLDHDGSLAVGDPAGPDESPDGGRPDDDRAVRDLVHRIGDDVPLLAGGEPCTPQALTAVLAMWVVEQATAQEYGPPECVVLSHPAVWGAHRTGLLRRALREIGLGQVTLLPEPITVAESHAALGFTGGTAAVHSFGGTGFEASVVRRNPGGFFEVVGAPVRLEPMGGADLDEALAEHVRTVLGREFRDLADPLIRETLLGLPAACARAKEELSVGTETDVQIRLPDGPARVPVTRAEFEEVAEPTVRATVAVLDRVIRSAGLADDALDGVLLAGGSARVPLVGELLAARFRCPVEVGADPRAAVATGAALAACQIVSPRPPWQSEGRRPAAGARRSAEEPDPSATGADGEIAPGVLARPDPEYDTFPAPPPRPPVRFSPPELPDATRLRLGRRRGQTSARDRDRVR